MPSTNALTVIITVTALFPPPLSKLSQLEKCDFSHRRIPVVVEQREPLLFARLHPYYWLAHHPSGAHQCVQQSLQSVCCIQCSVQCLRRDLIVTKNVLLYWRGEHTANWKFHTAHCTVTHPADVGHNLLLVLPRCPFLFYNLIFYQTKDRRM